MRHEVAINVVIPRKKCKITQTSSAYWLIRAMANRRLLDKDNNLQTLKLIETVKNTKPIGIIEFELPARNKSERRRIKQAIYIDRVRLSPP